MLKSVFVQARNIDEAHFKCIRELFQQGEVYVINRGSYEGHKRLEFDFLTLQITNPEERPLSPTMPQGIPPVTDEDSIYNYAAKYLMTDEVQDNEDYTYGQYIWQQVPKAIGMLRDTPQTNQATIAVCNEKSIDLADPPCLRQIDCRAKDGKLHFVLMFRSWDLWGGLPQNLGGLQILKEYMAFEAGLQSGETIAVSKGVHIYDMSWPVALARLGGNMPEDSVITKAEAELGEGWIK
jgi:thymidylate synthase